MARGKFSVPGVAFNIVEVGMVNHYPPKGGSLRSSEGSNLELGIEPPLEKSRGGGDGYSEKTDYSKELGQ
jgi:hypothetical protein